MSLNKIRDIWRNFADIGQDERRSAREVGCLHICNQIALAIALLVELYAPLYLFQGYPDVAIFNVVAGILILSTIRLNRYRPLPLLGRNVFLLLNNVLIFGYSIIFGRECWAHLFFINMMILPHIVFPPYCQKSMRVWSFIPPLLFFGLEIWGYSTFKPILPLTIEQQHGIFLLISPSVFIIAMLYTRYLYRMINRHEDALLQRIVELQKSSRLIEEQQVHLAAVTHFSAIAELSAGIAHEINNPLAIIRGYAEQLEILQRRQESNIGIIPQNIKATVDRITKITSSLRNLSREGSDVPFEEVDLRLVIKDVLMTCQEALYREGIDVRMDLTSDAALCFCRPVQIAQVLMNLIHNAKDAVGSLSEKWISIRLRAENGTYRITVVDSGRGIAPDILPRIFQPFFTTRPPGKGTGLGLSISRKILLAHKGELVVDTRAEQTTFLMCLPMRAAQV